MAKVDIDLNPGSGTFEATILDPHGSPAGLATVIQVSDEWSVDCKWEITGVPVTFPGTWTLQIVLEGLGAAAPEFAATETVAMTPLPNATQTATYSRNVLFGPNQPPPKRIDLPAGEDSISFQVTAVLTARMAPVPPATAGAPLPMAAYVDLGVVQIYRFPA